jgi:hypothetical protein
MPVRRAGLAPVRHADDRSSPIADASCQRRRSAVRIAEFGTFLGTCDRGSSGRSGEGALLIESTRAGSHRHCAAALMRASPTSAVIPAPPRLDHRFPPGGGVSWKSSDGVDPIPLSTRRPLASAIPSSIPSSSTRRRCLSSVSQRTTRRPTATNEPRGWRCGCVSSSMTGEGIRCRMSMTPNAPC